jgi:hypothetical protein
MVSQVNEILVPDGKSNVKDVIVCNGSISWGRGEYKKRGRDGWRRIFLGGAVDRKIVIPGGITF